VIDNHLEMAPVRCDYCKEIIGKDEPTVVVGLTGIREASLDAGENRLQLRDRCYHRACHNTYAMQWLARWHRQITRLSSSSQRRTRHASRTGARYAA
jgi:hypothetical protein